MLGAVFKVVFLLLCAVIFPPIMMIYVGWKSFWLVTFIYLLLYALLNPLAVLIWPIILIFWGGKIAAKILSKFQRVEEL